MIIIIIIIYYLGLRCPRTLGDYYYYYYYLLILSVLFMSYYCYYTYYLGLRNLCCRRTLGAPAASLRYQCLPRAAQRGQLNPTP